MFGLPPKGRTQRPRAHRMTKTSLLFLTFLGSAICTSSGVRPFGAAECVIRFSGQLPALDFGQCVMRGTDRPAVSVVARAVALSSPNGPIEGAKPMLGL